MTYILAEINFAKVDDEGNEEIDSKGNIKTFVPKGRWKELEYLCEDRNDEDFEEEKKKLYDTDFVIINKKTGEPFEALDVVYNSEALAEFLNSGEYQIAPDGDYEFVSMTAIKAGLQERYLEHFKEHIYSKGEKL